MGEKDKMADKKFCDKCGREIGFNQKRRAYVKLGVGGIGESLNFGDKFFTEDTGKQITLISTNRDLCLECYQRLVKFLEDKTEP